MMQRKTTDTFISLNDDLNVVYSTWENGAVFRRLVPLWSSLRTREFIAPKKNLLIASLIEQGVEWVLAEHVSITVQGEVRYRYDTAEGTVDDLGYPGSHNVDNGGGYLPSRQFTRWCGLNHISCCVVPKQGIVPAVEYDFSIEQAADPTALFSHEVQGLSGTFIIGRNRKEG